MVRVVERPNATANPSAVLAAVYPHGETGAAMMSPKSGTLVILAL